MKLLIVIIANSVIMLTPTLSYAFFCPTNFNQINIGDNIDLVKSQCGTPDKEDVKTAEPNVPQEWSYYVPQTVATNSNPSQQEQGTLKTSITFDKDGKAINISVNGIGVGSSTVCGANGIKLGATRDEIKSACGAPAFINKQQPDSNSPSAQPIKVNILTYNSSPPMILTFQNGILTSRQ